ncbi:MAG: hypothetical protein ACLFPJ_01625 [Candidatus Woesearchaeota archaeon]
MRLIKFIIFSILLFNYKSDIHNKSSIENEHEIEIFDNDYNEKIIF